MKLRKLLEIVRREMATKAKPRLQKTIADDYKLSRAQATFVAFMRSLPKFVFDVYQDQAEERADFGLKINMSALLLKAYRLNPGGFERVWNQMISDGGCKGSEQLFFDRLKSLYSDPGPVDWKKYIKGDVKPQVQQRDPTIADLVAWRLYSELDAIPQHDVTPQVLKALLRKITDTPPQQLHRELWNSIEEFRDEFFRAAVR